MSFLPSTSSNGTTPENPQCSFCTRLNEQTSGEQPTCEAFPEGIPAEILLNEFDHRNPHPQDNGLRRDPGSRGE